MLIKVHIIDAHRPDFTGSACDTHKHVSYTHKTLNMLAHCDNSYGNKTPGTMETLKSSQGNVLHHVKILPCLINKYTGRTKDKVKIVLKIKRHFKITGELQQQQNGSTIGLPHPNLTPTQIRLMTGCMLVSQEHVSAEEKVVPMPLSERERVHS